MAEVLKTNNMKKGPFKMKKGSPMERNFGISPMKDLLPEVTVSGGKGGKSRAQRDYDKRLEEDASMEYDRSRAFSTRGGPGQYGKLTEKEKNIYRAKAQKRDSLVNEIKE